MFSHGHQNMYLSHCVLMTMREHLFTFSEHTISWVWRRLILSHDSVFPLSILLSPMWIEEQTWFSSLHNGSLKTIDGQRETDDDQVQ